MRCGRGFLPVDSMENEFLLFYRHSKLAGRYGALSQFYEAEFTDPTTGIHYRWAEQWMMSGKAMLFKDAEAAAKIQHAKHPAQIKKMGRSVQGFDPELWDQRKYQIVVDGNRLKFGQNPKLRALLLGTGDKVLVEAAANDTIWGIGINVQQAEAGTQWRGQNLLGEALMQVRDEMASTGSPGEGP
eukprot:TRINITY_DN7840_c0_g6_i3.p1 TRINITY_DN7840_c0_g6~~TRINITY_DN7840_c0_g6_i3.p1  ORF type:complete len:185 (+),score=35.26 TRINITY_DN7840_c0_g6_i3:914-1468(+)